MENPTEPVGHCCFRTGLRAAAHRNRADQQEEHMRIEEIQAGTAAEQRVKRLTASAKAAKDRARQMKVQADASAQRLEMQKARQSMAQRQQSAVTSTIKPYH
jgi:hypothetical protein